MLMRCVQLSATARRPTCGSLLAPLAAGARIFGEQTYELNADQSLFNYVQTRGAARKGKRIQRAREARVRASARRIAEAQNPKKKKEQKRGVKVDKLQMRFLTERQLDMKLPEAPADDVFFMEKFRKKRFSLDEILEFHRQVVHPHVLNQPDALVMATIDLNLKMKLKKKKFIEHINSTVCYPHPFQYEIRPRRIIALCKNEEDQEKARQAGAVSAGGLDIVQLLKTNQLTQRDFNHIVCHSDFVVDFAAVKGMKAQGYFPSKQRGNFGDDIVHLVNYFKNGIDYSLKKNSDEPEHGLIDCYFGKLNMTNDQLRENLVELINHVSRFKPLNLADNKQFFQRVLISTPASEEIFLLKFWELTDEYNNPDQLVDEDEEAEQSKRAQ